MAEDGDLRALVHELQTYQQELQAQQAQLIEFQRELELSRDRYADLFEFAPVAYVTLDRNGVIGSANSAAARLVGLNRARSTGVPFLIYVHADDRRTFLMHMHHCRHAITTAATELRVKGRHEQVRSVLLSSHRLVAEDGSASFLTAIVDLTERIRAEEERRRAERERHEIVAREAAARAANDAKDRFLATLSHELRTPLTPILLALGTIEARRDVSEHVRAQLGMIRRNVQHESRLIDDLLDVTRIARDKLNLRSEPVDVHAVVRDLLSGSAEELKTAGVQAALADEAACHHVPGDATRIRQVFWNLLQNAIRHTPAGGRITVTTENPLPDRLRVVVADTGVGIDPEMLERIFTPFEQTGERAGGLGLGLAICKGLVTAHAGTIAAASAGRGKGATFTVELPVVAPSFAVAPPPAARRPPRAARLRPTILIVEDDRDSADALEESLSLNGYRVRVARTVREALAAGGRDVDVVISDIGLPDGSGLDVMRRLRARRPVPGIALSGYGSEQDVRASREAGFERHLVKPIDVDVLLRELEALHAPSEARGGAGGGARRAR